MKTRITRNTWEFVWNNQFSTIVETSYILFAYGVKRNSTNWRHCQTRFYNTFIKYVIFLVWLEQLNTRKLQIAMTPCRGVCWFKPNYRWFSQKRQVLNKEDCVRGLQEIQAINSIKMIELSSKKKKKRKSWSAMISSCLTTIECVYVLIDDPVKNVVMNTTWFKNTPNRIRCILMLCLQQTR